MRRPISKRDASRNEAFVNSGLGSLAALDLRISRDDLRPERGGALLDDPRLRLDAEAAAALLDRRDFRLRHAEQA
jgi:hypothetical protein